MKTLRCAFLVVAAALALPRVCEADGQSFFVVADQGVPEESGVDPHWKSGDHVFQSVAEAVSAAGAKDIIFLSPGTHTLQGTLVVDKRLTFRNASWSNYWIQVSRDDVVVTGDGTFPLVTLNGQNVSISGLSFEKGYTNDVDGASCVLAPQTSGSGFSLSDCVFRDNNSAAACIRSCKNGWWKIQNCVFSNNVLTADTFSGTINYGGVVNIEMPSTPVDVSGYGLIRNCLFTDNNVTANQVQGGIVAIRNGQVNMESCSFVSNAVSQANADKMKGGALFVGGNAKISNCMFTGATPSNDNHSIYGTILDAYQGNCIVSNCTFAAVEEMSTKTNKYGTIYGTIHVGGDGAKFVDCCFTNNSLCANSLLFLEKAGDMLVRNCLFANNARRYSNGRLIYLHGNTVTSSTALTVENCTFADNTDSIAPFYFASANYASYFINSVFTTDSLLSAETTASVIVSNCCITARQEIGGLTYNGQYITKAAGKCGFVDPEHGDYRLEMRSPLREKGVKLDWMTADAKDLDGNPRVVNRFGVPLAQDSSALPDIGCYECMIRVPSLVVVVR